MSNQDIVDWWESDALTEDDKIDWCAAAAEGFVFEPLVSTVPAEFRDEWLTLLAPEMAAVFVDEVPSPRVYELSDDLVEFIDANC